MPIKHHTPKSMNLGGEMGLLDGLTRRHEQKRLIAALHKMKPYVFSPTSDTVWWHWETLPTAEELGVLPAHSGLPVLMTKEECAIVNGGPLPQYWGEMNYAWRSESQRQAFQARHPEYFTKMR